MSGKWADCAKGCPISGGGSKLGQCRDRCGSSTALTNPAGYACYCDPDCVQHGDCCTGYQQQCGGVIVGAGAGEEGGAVDGNSFLLGNN